MPLSDNCPWCGGGVYPDDEKVNHSTGVYHVECAEICLPDEDEEE